MIGWTIQSAGPSERLRFLVCRCRPQVTSSSLSKTKRAREITEYRQRAERQKALAVGGRYARADVRSDQAGEAQELGIIRGDVQGSIEAIVGAG